jgi:hypothetical protein
MPDAAALNLKFRLNDAKTDVKFELPQRVEVDAATLSGFIDLLGDVRALMEPRFRANPPTQMPGRVINDAPNAVLTDPNAEAVHMLMCDDAYGWIGFSFSLAEAKSLADRLQAALSVSARPPTPPH